MACNDYHLDLYSEGVPLSRPYKDYGCVGEVHRFSVVTDLKGPVNYKWSVDGLLPVLSTNSFFDYKFDGEPHRIYAVAEGANCGIEKTISVYGKICTVCLTLCTSQTAELPPGELKYLTDEAGVTYILEKDISVICKDNSNVMAAKAVKRAIRAGNKCREGSLTTSIYNNQGLKNCLTLTINNSPIRFKSITVGKVEYLFDKTQC